MDNYSACLDNYNKTVRNTRDLKSAQYYIDSAYNKLLDAFSMLTDEECNKVTLPDLVTARSMISNDEDFIREKLKEKYIEKKCRDYISKSKLGTIYEVDEY